MWVPPNKNDVYVSSRRVANSVKVSLHEPGPARFALTREHVEGPNPIAVPRDDPRAPIEWDRPRPRLPDAPLVRPLSILVPATEVIERGYPETGSVVWRKPPASRGLCVEYDVLYSAEGLTVEGHPGARSMGTELVGTFKLSNGQQVWVVAWEHELDDEQRARTDGLRKTRVFDAEGNRIDDLGALMFGIEGSVGVLHDVTFEPEADDRRARGDAGTTGDGRAERTRRSTRG
jgi:hypothetical protein